MNREFNEKTQVQTQALCFVCRKPYDKDHACVHPLKTFKPKPLYNLKWGK